MIVIYIVIWLFIGGVIAELGEDIDKGGVAYIDDVVGLAFIYILWPAVVGQVLTKLAKHFLKK